MPIMRGLQALFRTAEELFVNNSRIIKGWKK